MTIKGKTRRRRSGSRGRSAAPRIPPSIQKVPWHKSLLLRLAGIGLLVGILLFAAIQVSGAQDRAKKRDASKAAVRKFDAKVASVFDPLAEPLDAMGARLQELKAGKVNSDQFSKEATGWVEQIQKAAAQISDVKAPHTQQARDLYAAALFGYLDAAKSLQLSVQTKEDKTRDALLSKYETERTHADLYKRQADEGLSHAKETPPPQSPG